MLMRGLLRFGRSFAIIVVLVGANGLLLTELIGLPYSGFAWKVLAQAYDTGSNDTDGDGIPDFAEPNGRVDFFDPSGCFYEVGTGEIRPGGRVEAISSPLLIQEDDGFDDGCYSYASDSPGLFQLSVTPPPFCILAPGCQPVFECPVGQGTCSPETRFNPNSGQAVFLGAPVDIGNPAFLESGDCSPYFLEIQLDSDDLAVAANNIAVQCDLTPAPAVSGWRWPLLGIALLFVAYWGLRREHVLQS